MENYQWLMENADLPIKYNLLPIEQRNSELENDLLSCPDVQYWLKLLREHASSRPIRNIHGSHDYRYENIMGKLSQMGLHAGINVFHQCCLTYLNFLEDQIQKKREQRLSFGKIYSYYDYELILSTFLAMAGYSSHGAVQSVLKKRIDLLYEFTKHKRYDIYVDGKEYPGVKKEWRQFLIDPLLYHDGNIRVPTIHDYILISVGSESLNEELAKKVDTIVDWAYDDRYSSIPRRYGYFYAPGGSYAAKAVCFKLDLPVISQDVEPRQDLSSLLLTVFFMSKFRTSKRNDWFKSAICHLSKYRNPSGRYLFSKHMLVEGKDKYWIYGGHMGIGENRRKRQTLEIESTYWKLRIQQQMGEPAVNESQH